MVFFMMDFLDEVLSETVFEIISLFKSGKFKFKA